LGPRPLGRNDIGTGQGKKKGKKKEGMREIKDMLQESGVACILTGKLFKGLQHFGGGWKSEENWGKEKKDWDVEKRAPVPMGKTQGT